MYLDIDGRPLAYQPHVISIRTDEARRELLADGRPQIQGGGDYAIVECTWGQTAVVQNAMQELIRLRDGRAVHSITFEPTSRGRLLTINARFPEMREGHIAYSKQSGHILSSSFTLEFWQLDLPTFLVPIDLHLDGVLAVLDGYVLYEFPAAGRIISVQGNIRDLGSGAGSTTVQLHNETQAKDYLTTPGEFINTSPVNTRLQSQVLAADLDFVAGDVLWVNVTGIPAGGLSKDAHLRLMTWQFRP